MEVTKTILLKGDQALHETGRTANQTIELDDFGITPEQLLAPSVLDIEAGRELEKVIIHTEFAMHHGVIQSVSGVVNTPAPS